MKVLDLFSGIGGFSLGLERAGMETVAFCEFDEHARAVLKKHWPNVPIYNDVRELDGKQFRGSVDVVCGGFPCQDVSVAGKGAGFSGERSSLYREMLRVVSECMPRYAIFENVTGLLSGDSGRWFARFLYDLAEIGYDAEWHCISASFIGALHHRDRVWVIAYYGKKRGKGRVSESLSWVRPFSWCQDVRRFEDLPDRCDLYPSKLCGSGDGVPKRVDRLARLGNAVVPAIPEAIGRAIMKTEGNHYE